MILQVFDAGVFPISAHRGGILSGWNLSRVVGLVGEYEEVLGYEEVDRGLGGGGWEDGGGGLLEEVCYEEEDEVGGEGVVREGVVVAHGGGRDSRWGLEDLWQMRTGAICLTAPRRLVESS